jgi:hypothetical protein
MADPNISQSTQQREPVSPEPRPQEPSGETNLSLALKAIFWFLIVPGGVLLLARWLLQP